MRVLKGVCGPEVETKPPGWSYPGCLHVAAAFSLSPCQPESCLARREEQCSLPLLGHREAERGEFCTNVNAE